MNGQKDIKGIFGLKTRVMIKRKILLDRPVIKCRPKIQDADMKVQKPNDKVLKLTKNAITTQSGTILTPAKDLPKE